MKKHSLLLLLVTLLLPLSSVVLANDYQLGIYELNRGKFKAAMAQFEPLAEDGFTPAQYQLAMMYKNGHGVIKNPQKAFELLSLAAEKNDSDAQFDLSLMYSEGKVVEQDLIKAFNLMAKSANKGLASAQYNLGVMYYQGQGIAKDNANAANWYQKAAKLNYALAQFNLALMYFEGEGVKKSQEKSYIWNVIAAYNGYDDAAKSRDMDAHKLTKAQVTSARAEADEIYRKIIQQAEINAKKANEKRFY
jgi:hypothetical protein